MSGIMVPIMAIFFSLVGLASLVAFCIYFVPIIMEENKKGWIFSTVGLGVMLIAGCMIFVLIKMYIFAAVMIGFVVVGALGDLGAPDKYENIPAEITIFGKVDSHDIAPAWSGIYDIGPVQPNLVLHVGDRRYRIGGDNTTIHLAAEHGWVVCFTFKHRHFPSMTTARYCLLPASTPVAGSTVEEIWRQRAEGHPIYSSLEDVNEEAKSPRKVLAALAELLLFIAVVGGLIWEFGKSDKEDRTRQAAYAINNVKKAAFENHSSAVKKTPRPIPPSRIQHPKDAEATGNLQYIDLGNIAPHGVYGKTYRYDEGFACMEIGSYIRGYRTSYYNADGKYCWPKKVAPQRLLHVVDQPMAADVPFKPFDKHKTSLLIASDTAVGGAVVDFDSLGTSCLLDEKFYPVGCWKTEDIPKEVQRYRELGVTAGK